MTTLSPAAQAVLDAYANRAKRDLHGRWVEPAIAAALRAAALILQEAYANEGYADHPDDLLLAIAAELEGAGTGQAGGDGETLGGIGQGAQRHHPPRS